MRASLSLLADLTSEGSWILPVRGADAKSTIQALKMPLGVASLGGLTTLG